MKIGIDFNGGDNSNEIAPAINEFIKTSKSEVYVFSTADNKNLEKLDQNEQIKIIECETAVKSSDDPAFVVRKKKNSTMVTGGEYLHQKKIDTFISAGNTGALVATGVFVVKRMLGVSKPALIGLIPSLKRKNPVMILDLGANINATEENLIEYAKLGTVYMREFYNINNPSVQLINIGEEPNKGIELYQNTYKQLTDNKEINFQGNIEPRNLLDTETDILVMDGWTGNILLKTLEGTLAFGKENLKKVFLKNIITKLGALTIKKDLSALKVQLDYKELGATPILGVDGLLLKCHGSSDEKAFNNALKKAEKFIEIELIQKMKKNLSTEI